MNDEADSRSLLDQPRLERNQFDLMTLMVLPMLLVYGFMFAYALRHWSFFVAVEAFDYFPQFVLRSVPPRFAVLLYDLPGIACLYCVIFALALCNTRLARIAIGILLIDWIAALFCGTANAPIDWNAFSTDTLGSCLLTLASLIPLAIGHTLRRYLNEETQTRWRQAVLALVILVAPITVWGYYFPIQ